MWYKRPEFSAGSWYYLHGKFADMNTHISSPTPRLTLSSTTTPCQWHDSLKARNSVETPGRTSYTMASSLLTHTKQSWQSNARLDSPAMPLDPPGLWNFFPVLLLQFLVNQLSSVSPRAGAWPEGGIARSKVSQDSQAAVWQAVCNKNKIIT